MIDGVESGRALANGRRRHIGTQPLIGWEIVLTQTEVLWYGMILH